VRLVLVSYPSDLPDLPLDIVVIGSGPDMMTVEEMRAWASIREPEPEASHSFSEAKALDWVARHSMSSLTLTWDEEILRPL
jgi:hypothetical protein